MTAILRLELANSFTKCSAPGSRKVGALAGKPNFAPIAAVRSGWRYIVAFSNPAIGGRTLKSMMLAIRIQLFTANSHEVFLSSKLSFFRPPRRSFRHLPQGLAADSSRGLVRRRFTPPGWRHPRAAGLGSLRFFRERDQS